MMHAPYTHEQEQTDELYTNGNYSNIGSPRENNPINLNINSAREEEARQVVYRPPKTANIMLLPP
jgi:hypothetical protein